MMTCDCNSCDRVASADCQWGSDGMPTLTSTLCAVHVNELREMLDPLLQENRAWFRIGDPGSIMGG